VPCGGPDDHRAVDLAVPGRDQTPPGQGVIEPLAFATTAVCALVALACLLFAARYNFARVLPYPVAVEVAMAVQTIAIVITRLGGYRPRESGENWAYVVTSLVVLPLIAPLARRSRWWAAMILAVALAVEATVVIRLQTTWRLP
jgi:hypothetical protein